MKSTFIELQNKPLLLDISQELLICLKFYFQNTLLINNSGQLSSRTVEIKGLCLELKRSGTEYAAQKINFLTSAMANVRPLPL